MKKKGKEPPEFSFGKLYNQRSRMKINISYGALFLIRVSSSSPRQKPRVRNPPIGGMIYGNSLRLVGKLKSA
jgi:ABC-type iron transport system FetAB permease component